MKNILLIAILSSAIYAGGDISPTTKTKKISTKQNFSKKDSRILAKYIIKKAFSFLNEMDKINISVENSEQDNRYSQLNFYKTDIMVIKPMKFKVHIYNNSNVNSRKIDREYFLHRGVFIVADNITKKFGAAETEWEINYSLYDIKRKYSIIPTLSSFLRGNLLSRFNPDKAKYFGTEYKNKELCSHVAFEKKGFVFHLWVKSQGKPYILGYSIIRKKTGQRLDAKIEWKNNKITEENIIFDKSKYCCQTDIKNFRNYRE